MSKPFAIPEHDADPREVARLLSSVAAVADLPGRLEVVSEALLGRPYVVGSLVGGPAEPERLVTRLDAFDCVTFCDSVIALATAGAAPALAARVQALRYHRGALGWASRNHYTHSWLERNVAAGLLEPLLPQLWCDAGPPRTLDILEGYPALTWQPRYLPWSCRGALEDAALPGDWVGFISHRPRLDTFHVGLLVRDGELWVRHASRSRGRVIQEPLATCMRDWDVPGLFVARPLQPPPDPPLGDRP
jgi:hypothetical protein